ncbi:MAG: oligosaccharide flippase family protein [Pseudomonadales bacterium]
MMRNLLAAASKYSMSNILIAVSGLISFPILTRTLSVENYGLISLINAFILFGVAFAKGGMQHSITRFYSDAKSEGQLQQYTSTSLTGLGSSSLIVATMIAIVFSLVSTYHASFLAEYSLSMPLVVAVIAIIVFQAARSSMLNFFLVMELSTLFASIQVYGKYIVIAATVVAILLIEASVRAFFFALLLGEFIALLMTVFEFNRRKTVTIKWAAIDTRMLKGMMLYSLPMLGYEVATIVHSIADRIVLDALMGKEAVGHYSAAYNIAELFNVMIAISLATAIQPMYYKMWSEEGKEQTVAFLQKVLHFYMALFPAVVWGVIVIGEDLLIFLASEKYAPGAVIFPFVITGLLMNATAFIYAAGLYLHKLTMRLFVPVLLCSALNIVLNFVLIPEFGLRGAGMSTLLSMMVLSVTMFFRGRAVLTLDVSLLMFAKYIAISSVMGVAMMNVDFGAPLPNIAVKVTLGIAIYSILLLMVDRTSRDLAARLMTSIRTKTSNG